MLTQGKYILKNGEPVEETDLETWARWYETHAQDCQLRFTNLQGVEISTVFLGLDGRPRLQPREDGAPLLFESMVSGSTLLEQNTRYATRDEALAGHNGLVDQVLAEQKASL